MWIDRIAEALARGQAARPWRWLVATLAVTAAAAVVTTRLGFDSSYEALLPEDSPQVRNLDDVTSRTGICASAHLKALGTYGPL